jgi:hypothetical protein
MVDDLLKVKLDVELLYIKYINLRGRISIVEPIIVPI